MQTFLNVSGNDFFLPFVDVNVFVASPVCQREFFSPELLPQN